MKAKLSNGEIVDVRYYSQDYTTKEIYSISYGEFGKPLTITHDFELIIENEPSVDWNKVRIDAAIGIYCKRFEMEPYNCDNFKNAVDDADALISELQKTKQ